MKRVSEHKLPNISFVPIITRTQILTSDYNTNIISEDESKASEDDPKMTKDFRRLPNRNSHYNMNLNPKYANRSQFLITWYPSTRDPTRYAPSHLSPDATHSVSDPPSVPNWDPGPLGQNYWNPPIPCCSVSPPPRVTVITIVNRNTSSYISLRIPRPFP